MWPGVAARFRNATGIEVTVDQVRNRAGRIGVQIKRTLEDPVEREKESRLPVAHEGSLYRARIGVVSDTHGGSKYEQNSALHAFYAEADPQVDFFVHAGDVTQGSDRMHLGMEHEVHAHGADAQARYVAASYPRSKSGKPTYMLGGNHDLSFLKDGGINVVKQITDMRDDLVYLGQDAAYLTIGPLKAYVIHPDGGGGVSKSLRGQKIAETLDPAINLLLIGHFHQWCQFIYRSRTHVFMLPCFQSQYGWLARKGLHPEIGGLILDLQLTAEGRIARVKPELIIYAPRANDYDREASAAVNEAWAPDGLEIVA